MAFSAVVAFALAQSASAQSYTSPATPMGPAPITDTEPNGNGANLASGNSAGGSTTSIITDPSNSATIWIGTASGGVWGSTDAGKTFVPLTDNQSSLSIGALAADPTSPANARTLIAGFGGLSNGAGGGGALNGLIVSHDGGASWAPLGAGALNSLNIGNIVADGSTIVAASPDAMGGGLFRSTDGGKTFAPIAGLNGAGTALVADPTMAGRLYAAIVPGDPSQARVVVSQNNGATWSTVFAAAQAGGTINTSTLKLRVAIGPTGALAIGVVDQTLKADKQVLGLFYSANPTGGAAFASLGLPAAVAADGYKFGLNPGGQANVNFAMAVDPHNPGIVYVSGDRQALNAQGETQDPGFQSAQPPDSIGAKNYTATVFKITVAPDGSNAFQAITDNFTGNLSAPHADTRAIAFTSDGSLLLGSDGGLYTRSQPNSPAGVWDSRNGGLGAIETYQSAYDPISGRIYTAAQDNGVASQAAPGGRIFNSLIGGDGFNAAVDTRTLAAQQQSIVYLGVNSLTLVRLVYGAQALVRGDPLNLVVQPSGTAAAIPLDAYENPPTSPDTPAGTVPIASKFVLNRIDPRLAAFGTTRVYTATFDPAAFTGPQAATPAPIDVKLTDLTGMNLAPFTSLAYGTRDNTGALIAAAGGFIFASTSATPALGTLKQTGSFEQNINALVFDPDNSTHFYAAANTTVFGTANGGASYTDLRGNLPTTFQNIGAAEFISDNGVRALFAGGSNAVAGAQSTVYVSLANALGTWTPFSTGLPNAIVSELTYTPEADLLLVTTYGRGSWVINDVTSNFASATQLQFGLANNDSAPNASQLTDGVDANGQPFGRGLLKEGGGTLTLNVPATYTGQTVLNGGTVRAAAANVFAPTSDNQLAAMTLLDLGGFDQAIGSLGGAGKVALGAGTLTTGGSGASTSFAGTIAGTGGMTKVGAGVFTLAGVNSYTGPTNVAAGTLGLVGGSTLTSAVTVQSGAILAAAGAAPGTTPAQVAGLAALPGSTLALSPASATQPTLASTGAVTLAGTITVAPAAALEVPKTELLLVSGSSITDNRALVTSVGPLRAVADPMATSFSVLLVSGERDLAQGPLQTAVANVIDADVATGRDTQLTRSLFAGTVAEQGADLRTLSGVGLTAFETAAVAGARRFQQAVGAHIAGFDTTSGPARQLALAAGAMGGASGTVADGKLDAVLANASAEPVVEGKGRFWIEGLGGFDDYSAEGDAPSVHTSGGGVVLGAETDAIAGTRLGAAFGYDKASLRSEGLTTGARVEAYRVAAYGRTSLGARAPWIGASVDYSRSVGRGTRDLSIGLGGTYPLVGEVGARPDGNTVAGQIQIGQHFSLDDVDIVPTVAVQALNYDQGVFVETGTTGAELAVAKRQRTAARTVLGAAASRAFTVGGATVTPAASLGWAHEFADRGAAFDAAFVAGGSVFRVDGVRPSRDAALLAASLSVQAARRVAIYIGYDATLARRATEQGVTGGVRLTW